ncbi:MAG TPA: ornithine carbamoyltransferase [Desulfomonilaceae bacterium]|nr:ornithine carbamoyltransferase [Desulfomonilaceae bacterium]
MGKTRHFLSLSDFSRDEILALIGRTAQIKKCLQGQGPSKPLEGRFVGMIFEKPSTRTRVSFHVGISQLGGNAVYLNWQDIQIRRGEPIRDTARVLSRYLDAIVIRTFGHAILEEFAAWSSVPVINGLSDLHHPCQVLGDLFTLHEAGTDLGKMNAAWVGDGNNMANSWIEAASIMGFRLALACPEGYEPALGLDSANVHLVRDPVEAVRAADVVSTDVWASMGQEAETEARLHAFQGYQVNKELLTFAHDPVYVLHCLPAHRGEEITDEVLESPQSLVWEQAENRLHVQKAVLEMLVGG